MSDHEAGYLDDTAAERLLDGANGHARLHALLSAAAAPARPEELAGEDAAVAAFRAAAAPARVSWPARLRRYLTVNPRVRRLLTIKGLVAVAVSLILTGGVAYATITGHFPGQGPTPSPSPSLHERKGPGQDNSPATRFPPAAPPSKNSPKPAPGASKQHGKSSAPGQQKPKPDKPGKTRTPPRGPGNDNGTPPTDNPQTTKSSGGGSGSNNGTPPPPGHGRPD